MTTTICIGLTHDRADFDIGEQDGYALLGVRGTDGDVILHLCLHPMQVSALERACRQWQEDQSKPRVPPCTCGTCDDCVPPF